MRKLRVSAANLLAIVPIVILLVLIASWVMGILIACLQFLMVALIVFVGAALIFRWRSARSAPASKQIVDQPTAPNPPKDNSERITRQIEERRKRLKRDN